jgi:hypothetical protein
MDVVGSALGSILARGLDLNPPTYEVLVDAVPFEIVLITVSPRGEAGRVLSGRP